MKKLVICGLTSVLLLAGCIASEPEDGKYAELAKCLTGKGVKFYGAFWCPNCTNQKKLFGDDIRYIEYIECDPRGENPRTDECKKAGIDRYPSWFFPGQGLVTGTQKPEDLARQANCEVTTSTQETQAAPTAETTATQPVSETAAPSTSETKP